MLRRLTVENYALIEHLEIEFDSSLNIITGETGAGKSILMGALALLLGAKNDSTTVKDGSRACVVEGEFDIANLGLEEIFAELDIDYDHETIIRRTIQFGLDRYPELDTEGHIERAISHLKEKYGRGGYLKLWIPWSDNAAHLSALQDVIADDSAIYDKVSAAYNSL